MHEIMLMHHFFRFKFDLPLPLCNYLLNYIALVYSSNGQNVYDIYFRQRVSGIIGCAARSHWSGCHFSRLDWWPANCNAWVLTWSDLKNKTRTVFASVALLVPSGSEVCTACQLIVHFYNWKIQLVVNRKQVTNIRHLHFCHLTPIVSFKLRKFSCFL